MGASPGLSEAPLGLLSASMADWDGILHTLEWPLQQGRVSSAQQAGLGSHVTVTLC